MFDLIIFIIQQLITVYAIFMLIYCLATWIFRNRNNPIFRFFAMIAEPPLKPIRRFLYRFEYFRNSPVDFSSLILFFILRVLIQLLGMLAGWI